MKFKQKSIERVIPIFIMLLLLLSTVGCGKSTSEESTTTTEKTSAHTTTETTKTTETAEKETTEAITATTTKKTIPTKTSKTTSSSVKPTTNNQTTKRTETVTPPKDLESEYTNAVADLKFSYNSQKYEITTYYDNLLVSNVNLKTDLEAQKRSLASQCNSATAPFKSQLSSLQTEKSQFMATNNPGNSYYDTKIRQYDQQISSLNNQIASIESQYQNKINDVNSQIENIPSKEETKALKEQELLNLDAWYETELAKLNKKYGK